MTEDQTFELCPCCAGDAEGCVWCEDSGCPGFVEHSCDWLAPAPSLTTGLTTGAGLSPSHRVAMTERRCSVQPPWVSVERILKAVDEHAHAEAKDR